MLKISHTITLEFLAEINLNLVKNQHICFHGNHGSNMAVGVVSTAYSRRILIFCLVYVKYIPFEVVI